MYKHDQIGPWPIIDPSLTKVALSTPEIISTWGTSLVVCLNAANLGSNSEAFINMRHSDPAILLTTKTTLSYGVCLQPLEVFTSNNYPAYIDLSISAFWDPSSTGIIAFPWVGFIDAGLTPTTGFNGTNNLVTNYVPIPGEFSSSVLNCNRHVLIKDIVSGSQILDQFVCVGFSLFNTTTTTLSTTAVDYHISARYSKKEIGTL